MHFSYNSSFMYVVLYCCLYLLYSCLHFTVQTAGPRRVSGSIFIVIKISKYCFCTVGSSFRSVFLVLVTYLKVRLICGLFPSIIFDFLEFVVGFFVLFCFIYCVGLAKALSNWNKQI